MRQLVLACGILGGWIPLVAQSVSPVYDETVVVSAALEPSERDEVPATVSVVDGAEIEARQATTVVEAIALVPGLASAASGGPGKAASVFLRGADSNQTLVLWNGVPLNEPLLGGFDWAYLPTDGVTRVEVVRGPFSALYGSSAIGGVVNVLTGTAPEQRGAARVEAGERQHRRVGLDGGWNGERLGAHGAAHGRDGEGELPNDGWTSRGASLRLEGRGAAGVAGLLLRRQEDEARLPLDYTLTERRPHQRNEWEEWQAAVPLRAGGRRWELDALLSRTATELRFLDPDDPVFTASRTDATVDRGRLLATWFAAAAGGGDAGAGRGDLWLAAGGEWERQTVSNESNFGVAIDGEERRNRAGFVQAHLAHGRIAGEAGVRYDADERFGSAVSPRLGVVFAAHPSLRLRASWGEGFRAPSLGERFFPFSGNPDLEPERSRSGELAVEATPGRWRLVVAGFETRQRDLVDFDFATSRNVNLGAARSRGIELETGWRGATVEARLGATWLDAVDERSGLALLRRPERSASLLVLARRGAWSGNLVARHVGARDDVDPSAFPSRRVTNPAYERLDLAVRWQARPWLAPYARLENATDEAYAEVYGYPAPGRTAIGGVALRF